MGPYYPTITLSVNGVNTIVNQRFENTIVDRRFENSVNVTRNVNTNSASNVEPVNNVKEIIKIFR